MEVHRRPTRRPRFAIVEDQEAGRQAASTSRAQCPGLEYVIYDDPGGLRHYKDSCLLSLQELPGARG